MDQNKTLTICSPQLGISPYSTLGGEVYDREVLKRMGELGAKIEVLLPKNRPFSRTKNVNVSFAPIKHIAPPYLYSFVMLPYLFKTYKKNHFEILRIHSHFLAIGALIFKLYKPNIRLVSHYHLDHEGILVNALNRLLLNSSDLVIADSNFLKKRLIMKFPRTKNKIKVIHTGVDQKTIKPLKPNQDLIKKYTLKNQTVLVFLGRFIKRKNPQFLIRLMEKLPKNISLILIGRGPEQNNLLVEAKKRGVADRVIFPGPLFGKVKLSHYSISDIFVFPSLNEGFVLAVLEGMSAGLPLVLPNSGAFPEALENGVNGYLVKPNNLEDWSEKITKLAKNKNLRLKMEKASRQKVLKEFTWDIVARKNLKAYKSIT